MDPLTQRDGSNYGEDPGGYRIGIGDFITLCLIPRIGLLDFPSFGFASPL